MLKKVDCVMIRVETVVFQGLGHGRRDERRWLSKLYNDFLIASLRRAC
jgi:hypothetical protein